MRFVIRKLAHVHTKDMIHIIVQLCEIFWKYLIKIIKKIIVYVM